MPDRGENRYIHQLRETACFSPAGFIPLLFWVNCPPLQPEYNVSLRQHFLIKRALAVLNQKSKKMLRFDALVIGAGPGGIAAATRGTLKGLKVGLVNGQSLGGYGIHGAYKSKGMYEMSPDSIVTGLKAICPTI